MHKFQLKYPGVEISALEEWLNSEKPEQIVMHFVDQGGWPESEQFKVDEVLSITSAKCTVLFDEVVINGCGASKISHIHVRSSTD